MEYNNCPHCNASLLGDPIPEDKQELYGGTHFKREIGIYDGELDITIAYKCPYCEGEWWRNGRKKDGVMYTLADKTSIKP